MKLVLLLLSLFASANLFADELTGTWTLDIQTPRGLQHPTLVITSASDKYSGVYNSMRGPIAIDTITRDGNSFSFPMTVSVPIGDINVTYSGSIDGERMKGTVKNPRGEVPFTGTRTSP